MKQFFRIQLMLPRPSEDKIEMRILYRNILSEDPKSDILRILMSSLRINFYSGDHWSLKASRSKNHDFPHFEAMRHLFYDLCKGCFIRLTLSVYFTDKAFVITSPKSLCTSDLIFLIFLIFSPVDPLSTWGSSRKSIPNK